MRPDRYDTVANSWLWQLTACEVLVDWEQLNEWAEATEHKELELDHRNNVWAHDTKQNMDVLIAKWRNPKDQVTE